MVAAYYNEIDPYAAQWLRNLIAKGHIAPGEVDERSVEDVCPKDLKGFTQCHFFAGIGVWSYALRKAGWPDDREVWTGSCPCQPFSTAGKGAGFADERHLWPAFHHLISVCKPPIVFGEQVAGTAGAAWWALVARDLQSLDYRTGAAIIPAASAGAPCLRERLFWGSTNPRKKSAWPDWQSRHTKGKADFWAGLVLPPRSSMVNGDTKNVSAVGALGNAIVPQVACAFVSAFMEAQNEQ